MWWCSGLLYQPWSHSNAFLELSCLTEDVVSGVSSWPRLKKGETCMIKGMGLKLRAGVMVWKGQFTSYACTAVRTSVYKYHWMS